jgi:hypothetical protein
MRWIRCLAVALLVLHPGVAAAEWHLKPFLGLTFGGKTTFVVDAEDAAGKVNGIFGVTVVRLGNVFGVDADFGTAPGYFEAGQDLVLNSRVRTLTGNVVVAVPKTMAGYALRPYFVGGMGLMHVAAVPRQGILPLSRTLPAWDIGGGVTGFLNERVGLSWELRHFHSFGGDTQGDSFEPEQLSFWRANMAVTFRYGQ